MPKYVNMKKRHPLTDGAVIGAGIDIYIYIFVLDCIGLGSHFLMVSLIQGAIVHLESW